MLKYELLPKQLQYEGTCNSENFFEPEKASDRDVLLTHTSEYLRALKSNQIPEKEQRKVGFPWSQQLVERELIIAQGTITGSLYALDHGIAMNIAGGTHHAFSNRGEAFCMLNDQAIAANYLIKQLKVKKILILDLDVHQGNGTAEIFSTTQEVFTFSMHGQANYPFKKEHSDWDIALEKGIGDSAYLSQLQSSLEQLLPQVQPDFVFYLSGVDVLASDKLGTLGLSMAGCRQRDIMVFNWCKANGIPVQCSMGGGYSPDIRIIVEAHANTYRAAQEIFF
ncbi:MAG: hypothetical protein RLZZ241_1010 [Bacteroidota bacterium]|jgi:acetoin utilization deacetylase AcuC-like enzyme